MERCQALKRMYRYLKGTVNLGLKYCSIEYSTEFKDKFDSLIHLSNNKGVVYKSLHQRTTKDKDICALTSCQMLNDKGID